MGTREALDVGDSISYVDMVSAGRLVYTHDGSNTLQDGLHLLLRGPDGMATDPLELQIMVVRGDFLPPQRDRGAAWMISVDEGTPHQNLHNTFCNTDDTD